jgi:proton-translocating NADH-quinone oxidoreductase chain L
MAYLNIIFLPLIGSLNTLLFGRFIGVKGSCIVTITCITLTMLLSYFSLYEVAFAGSPCYITFFTWFDSEMFHLSWGFLFDTLTCVMLVVVTTVSMFVHIYSTEYMKTDPHIQRFMAYLSLFTFFMVILVTSDNFLQMFLGWEGVGLCSYLLINFWYGRLQANKAALKAMIVNRIGDFGLALGVFAIFLIFQGVEYSVVFALAPYFYNDLIIFFNYKLDALTLICLFLFVGAVGKSAQIGLHTWLPDAMEGPTPVSALIHAATMVTAGVFLIARCSPLFEYAPFALMIVTIMGAMTAFLAATTGLLQNDLKRVIAY